jgi:hypothetical protein
VVCSNATTLWHFDAAEWAPSTASKADFTALKRDFRYAPESGLKSDIDPCPLSAKGGSGSSDKKPRKVRSVFRDDRAAETAVLADRADVDIRASVFPFFLDFRI